MIPVGVPNRCPFCDAAIYIETSQPCGDAPCPNCGTMLWFNTTLSGCRFFDELSTRPIREKVFAIICEETGFNRNELAYDLTIVGDLGLESLEDLELIMAIEEAFKIKIPNEDGMQITTVTIRYLVDLVLRSIP